MGENFLKMPICADLGPICSVIEPMLSTFPMMQQIFPKSGCNLCYLSNFLSIVVITEQVISSIFC